MYYPAVGVYILEVHEPEFTVLCLYPSTLMRAVHLGLSLRHHYPFFIWTIWVRRSQHCLPTGLDTTGWREDVVLAFMLIELRSLDRWLGLMTVINHAAAFLQGTSVRSHLSDEKHRLHSCP